MSDRERLRVGPGHHQLTLDGWGGLIALVLAVGVSVALASSLIIISLTPSVLDQQLASVITALAGAAVGGLSAYLGISKSAPEPRYAPPETTPADEPPADEPPGDEPPPA